MPIDPIELSQALIRCKSVTPTVSAEDGGALETLVKALEPIGFDCKTMTFSDDGTPDVHNLYARLGDAGKNLCFAGHTDVVQPGDERAWTHPPFDAVIEDDVLYGRGAVDMKPAIAAWVAAVSRAVEDGTLKGSLSLLITGDEEGPAINGTRKVLHWLEEKDEVIDDCIVGEPTNPKHVGEMVKIGRRGSVHFHITVHGVQGHVAYPHLADNPVLKLQKILGKLMAEPLDEGTDHFDPSNLEITQIYTAECAENMIPGEATARINIRFNDQHTGAELEAWVKECCEEVTGDYSLKTRISGEAFFTQPGHLSDVVVSAITEISQQKPELSTTGGTSDARFIRSYCPVVEFGLINDTAHKVDEHVRLGDIRQLTDIYEAIIRSYF